MILAILVSLVDLVTPVNLVIMLIIDKLTNCFEAVDFGESFNSGDSEDFCEFSDSENIARIANAVPVTLYSRVTLNVKIVVLNCQKCNHCLKGHKSQGLSFEDIL